MQMNQRPLSRRVFRLPRGRIQIQNKIPNTLSKQNIFILAFHQNIYKKRFAFHEANTLIQFNFKWKAAQTEKPIRATSLKWNYSFRSLRELKAIFFKGNAYQLL